MPNPYFQFKQFIVHQDQCAMKVTTDACLFGAWVAGILGEGAGQLQNSIILDIGAGTGLLSLMLAQQISVSIDAIEMDKAAALQAAANFESSPWSRKLHIIQGDVRNYSPEFQYDIVISNPPFYEKEIPSNDPGKNLAHHGEQLLLRELMNSINRLLNEDGCCFLLLPAKRYKETIRLIADSGFGVFLEIKVRPSETREIFRVMLAIRKKYAGNVSSSAWSIADGTGKYTLKFTQQLQDYYLHL